MVVSQSTSCYDACPEICGKLDHPGLATDIPRWIDHTNLDTTVDQARIEEALAGMSPSGRQQILHVGVGNSRLAQRYAPRVHLVDGPRPDTRNAALPRW